MRALTVSALMLASLTAAVAQTAIKPAIVYSTGGKFDKSFNEGVSMGAEKFKKESGKHVLWHGNFYAAQSFDNAPGGRRIQIGWGNGITFPGMPFNQQMTIPVELTLRTTDAGVRMFANPVKELDALHDKKHTLTDLTVKSGENPLSDLKAELIDLRVEYQPAQSEEVTFNLRGVPIVYNTKKAWSKQLARKYIV